MNFCIKSILFFVLISISNLANSQNLLGFGGHFNFISTASGDSVNMKKYLMPINTYGYGLKYKHFEMGPIGFQAELNIDNRGFKIYRHQENQYDTIYMYQKLKYLNIPIMMHVDFGKHAFKFIIAAGAYGDFLLEKGEFEDRLLKYGAKSQLGGFAKLTECDYKKFTYGAMGQVGFAICTKAGVFNVYGQIAQDMTSCVKLKPVSLFNFFETRTICAGFSYMVSLGNQKYWTKKEKLPKEPKQKKSNMPVDSLLSDTLMVNDSLQIVEPNQSQMGEFDFSQEEEMDFNNPVYQQPAKKED